MARIYISSSFLDLVEERCSARDAVVRLDHLPVAMETYTATDRRPLEQCLEDVASCRLVPKSGLDLLRFRGIEDLYHWRVASCRRASRKASAAGRVLASPRRRDSTRRVTEWR